MFVAEENIGMGLAVATFIRINPPIDKPCAIR
jgi:hypothetical protein